MTAIVDAGAEPFAGFDESDFESGGGEDVGADAAAGAAANNANVMDGGLHG